MSDVDRPATRLRWVPALVASAFVAWVAFAARGPRGTDQYWYVGDVAITRSGGGRVTNHVYPFAVEAAAQGDLPVRIHDLPATDVVALISRSGLSPYASWVTFNVVLLLLSALLILFASRVIAAPGHDLAWLAPTLFLVLPATTWFAVNALVEATIACGVSLCLAGWAWWQSGRGWGLVVQALGVGVLLLHRDNFVLAALASIIAVAWVARRRDRGWAAGSVVVVVAAGYVASRVFASYPTAGLGALLMVGGSGSKSSMDTFFGDVPFVAADFADKVMANALHAVVPGTLSDALVLVPSILLFVIGFAWSVVTRRTWLVALFAVTGLVWFATSTIFQPAARYSFMLAPLGAAAFPGVLGTLRTTRWWTISRIAVLVAVPASVLAALGVAMVYRNDARSEGEMVASLSTLSSRQPSGAVLSVSGSPVDIPLAYAVSPRVTLSVDPRINSTDDVARWMRALDVRVVVGQPEDEPFIREATARRGDGTTLRLIGTSASPGGDVNLWELQPQS